MRSSHSSAPTSAQRGGKNGKEKGKDGRDMNTPVPAVQLLSNGHYHLMVSAAGSGYSRYNDNALIRWREDSTCDSWGAYVYVRDLASGNFWATSRQPVFNPIATYRADFGGASAVLRTDTPEISLRTDIAVSPDDPVELRKICITNRTDHSKTIDLTSYAEVVLASAAADDAHPAFNKLFIQTEILDQARLILCHKRPGGGDAPAPWLFHSLVAETLPGAGVSYETDRMRFIGRGNTCANPQAIHDTGALSGSQGSVLDPIVAIRCAVALEPGQSVTVSYLYGVGDTRETCLALAEKYRDSAAVDAAFGRAAQYQKQALRKQGITQAQADLYGRLADSIVYNNASRRADAAAIASNQRGQSGLWGFSVSGDLPIVLLQVGASVQLGLAHELLQMHAYLRSKGLAADLVIINAQGVAGSKGRQDALLDQITQIHQAALIDQRGGIFVRLEKELAAEDRLLFLAVARAVFDDQAGTLADQLGLPESTGNTALPSLPESQSRQLDGSELQMLQAAVAPMPAAKARRPASVAALRPGLVFDNGVGGFTADGQEYVITLAPGQATPAPWVNVLANPFFGTIVSESGCANTWSENAHEFRLTPWSNDPVSDSAGEAFYICDEDSGHFWSPSPWPSRGSGSYTCRHGFGYSVFEHEEGGIVSELTIYVARSQPIKFAMLKIHNRSGRARRLSAMGYVEWVLGDLRGKTQAHVATDMDPATGAILARNAYSTEFGDRHAFFGVDQSVYSATADRAEFIGRNGALGHPAAMTQTGLSGACGAALDPCAALHVPFDLPDGAGHEIIFRLGAGRDQAQAQAVNQRFHASQVARDALTEVKDYWARTLGAVQIETPDRSLDMLGNGWLVYQTLACRVWARSAFYQPGGAFGFRDQLQDVMALVHTEPGLVREHILLSASRQYPQGDVQHWWHPPQGRGVRTRCSDDFLWLPLAVCRYVSATGDAGILDVPVHFLTGRPLKPDEESYYELPGQSDDTAPLYDHCVRAVRHGLSFGAHGLPLMGTGDWNDGMNKVGAQGKGESVWLAFFLHYVLLQFGPVAQARGDTAMAAECEKEAARLRGNIDMHAWDGDWFRRAYFDNGAVLGSAENTECQIDSIAQSWSVLSKAADPRQARQAMEAVDRHLVVKDQALIKLLAPPFDTSVPDPGYIKAYVPGVRENGGQYTHAAVWAVMAFAALQDKQRAWQLLSMINPLRHALSPGAVEQYKVEPYVVASDVYALPPHTGRGGWTWYSGSAGWLYRLIVESVLGLRRQADKLYVEPCIPEEWESFKMRYRYGASHYFIYVRQQRQAAAAVRLSVDGVLQDGAFISLLDDGLDHQVDVVLSIKPSGK
jgi:cellobiose phosphorylase